VTGGRLLDLAQEHSDNLTYAREAEPLIDREHVPMGCLPGVSDHTRARMPGRSLREARQSGALEPDFCSKGGSRDGRAAAARCRGWCPAGVWAVLTRCLIAR